MEMEKIFLFKKRRKNETRFLDISAVHLRRCSFSEKNKEGVIIANILLIPSSLISKLLF